MKLLVIAFSLYFMSLFMSSNLANFKAHPNYTKFQKAEVNSSGKTCKPSCYVRHTSRYVSYLSGTCVLNRVITDGVYADMTVWHKVYGSNYRQLINVNRIDACAVIGTVERFPLFKGPMEFLNRTFPDALHSCPWTLIRVVNASISDESRSYLEMFIPSLSNGIYKFMGKLYDSFDEKIATGTAYIIAKRRERELTF